MSFVLNDYTHALNIGRVDPKDVRRCHAAWGSLQERRKAGFLVEFSCGGFAYISGSCDLTGWGGDDRATVIHFATRPSLNTLTVDNCAQWVEEPADLNLWISRGSVDPYPWA